MLFNPEGGLEDPLFGHVKIISGLLCLTFHGIRCTMPRQCVEFTASAKKNHASSTDWLLMAAWKGKSIFALFSEFLYFFSVFSDEKIFSNQIVETGKLLS